MARLKSLLSTMQIDKASRGHRCRTSSKHQISQGDYRLSIKENRSYKRYCIECAKKILGQDIKALQDHLQRLTEIGSE